MADVSAQNSAPASGTTPRKGKGAGKAKKSKAAPSHPKVSLMVSAAITNLKERGGSSLQAIKKYIGSHYKVDVERLSPFIKKYLKSAVASGTLIQTKGKGATGSFRISGGPGAKPKAALAKKKSPPAKKAKSAAKPAKPKKVAAKKKAPKKTPSKPKAKKPKATKPKSPKPKKAKPAPKKAAKKARK